MPLNIKLKQLNCDGVWNYNFIKDNDAKCQICRKSLMAPSYEDLNNKKLISRISLGKCGHAYHSTCINTYCKKNVSCPIDFTTWSQLKELESNNTMETIKK